MIRCDFVSVLTPEGVQAQEPVKMQARCRAGTTAAPPCTAGTARHIAGSVDVHLEKARAQTGEVSIKQRLDVFTRSTRGTRESPRRHHSALAATVHTVSRDSLLNLVNSLSQEPPDAQGVP